MEDCIFCKIASGEIKTSFVKETNNVFVIKDINPKAPIHYLIIPKKHIVDLRSFSEVDKELAGEILLVARDLSKELSDCDFRLIANNGKSVGQSVFHSHFHFVSGKKMEDF